MDRVGGDAALVGSSNSLVAFAPGVVQEEREDIQDVLLYADLFASQVYNRKKNWHSWMHVYRDRLVARGVQQQTTVVGDSVVLSSVDDLARSTFKIIGPSGSSQLAELVRQSFDALGINQIADAFFRGRIEAHNLQSFQVISCEKTVSGEVSVLLCALHLSAEHSQGSRRRLILHFKGGGYKFDSGTYAQHRNSVSDYLNNKARVP